jgi:membrane protease YdiL (CAAX protease family)
MKHLESALAQGNQWWKYLLVLIIGFLIGQTIGAIPLFIVMGVKIAQSGGNFVMPDNPMDLSAYGIDPNLGIVLIVIPFIASLFIAILLIKAFHQRSFMQVVNGRGAFRWNRFWKGFLVWGIFFLALLFLGLLHEPENFELNFNLSSFIPLVIISFCLIPLQAGTEEFFFRGYLA